MKKPTKSVSKTPKSRPFKKSTLGKPMSNSKSKFVRQEEEDDDFEIPLDDLDEFESFDDDDDDNDDDDDDFDSY